MKTKIVNFTMESTSYDDIIGITINIQHYSGSPAQRFSVVVDTGSSNFAVAGSSDVGIDRYFNSKE